MASLNQTLEHALGQVGIDGNRARFYLAALELGEATIAAVSHHAGIGRTNAYEVLERLIADGLISRIQRGAKVFVQAQDPFVILRRIEEQRRLAAELLPQLRSLHNRAGSKPRVRYTLEVAGGRWSSATRIPPNRSKTVASASGSAPSKVLAVAVRNSSAAVKTRP